MSVKFAVIDTETNWSDKVMSLGIVISEFETFDIIDRKYYVLTPECSVGGMFSSVMDVKSADMTDSRKAVISDVKEMLKKHGTEIIFAYNAKFDYSHLPELKNYGWYDIMKLAAYRQYNRFIPSDADCCSTGKLKRNYGVEAILKMISEKSYSEVHNALCDAEDELKIMRILGHNYDVYEFGKIN